MFRGDLFKLILLQLLVVKLKKKSSQTKHTQKKEIAYVAKRFYSSRHQIQHLVIQNCDK